MYKHIQFIRKRPPTDGGSRLAFVRLSSTRDISDKLQPVNARGDCAELSSRLHHGAHMMGPRTGTTRAGDVCFENNEESSTCKPKDVSKPPVPLPPSSWP